MKNKQEILNEKLPTFSQILKMAAVADNPKEFLQLAIKKDKRIIDVLGYCFNPNYKFLLPEGKVEFKLTQFPEDLGNFGILHMHSKFYVMCNPSSKQFIREGIFIRWLENMSPEEVEVMFHMKDQTLGEMYTSLPEELFIDVLGWDIQLYLSLKKKNRENV